MRVEVDLERVSEGCGSGVGKQELLDFSGRWLASLEKREGLTRVVCKELRNLTDFSSVVQK